MTFIQQAPTFYLQAFTQMFRYQGRATRSAFWSFVLINYVVSFGFGYLDGWLHWGAPLRVAFIDQGPLSLTYMLLVLPAYTAVSVRRLHDTDRSGWWLIIGLIPLLGFIWLFVLFLMPSKEVNRFGWPESARVSTGGVDPYALR